MAEKLPVLLVGVDPGTLRRIRSGILDLDGIAVSCTEGSFEEALQLARSLSPDVVLVLMDGDTRLAVSFMEEISRNLPAIQIFALSRNDTTENIVKAMRAGATEFLSLPLDTSQVIKAFVKATTLSRLLQPATSIGEIWTVYSPKGGAGTTMTAANLAVETHTELGKSVCLVDLDFQTGDLALALNLTPEYTIVDIALNFRRLDSVFLQGTLARHASGIYLLAAPPTGGIDGPQIPADQIRAVLDLLKSMYDVVIVDTARAFSEETMAGLWSANRIILLIERSMPFLRGYRRTLTLLDGIGVPRQRVEVVIAKYQESGAAVPLDEAKKTLDLSVRHLLPMDEHTALDALNKGLPLADIKRTSPLRLGIRELAHMLVGRPQHDAAPKKRKGLLRGIFSS